MVAVGALRKPHMLLGISTAQATAALKNNIYHPLYFTSKAHMEFGWPFAHEYPTTAMNMHVSGKAAVSVLRFMTLHGT